MKEGNSEQVREADIIFGLHDKPAPKQAFFAALQHM